MQNLEQVKDTIMSLIKTVDSDFNNFYDYVESIENNKDALYHEMQLAEVLKSILLTSQM